ncbi:MAG: sigma-54-dependent Fis family transcriptional regulator [Planctomycetales bacterium]|nr:sigma-54-dependent Fis family transcriptional regulator [Planctomycetales bacterium]
MSELVLVVDDEPSICWAFERLLQAHGHRVVSASSAEEGLQIAEKQKPAMVLLDVRLPREDGISALPKFITATDGAPVVVMTAFGDLETAVAAVERGASDYLIKPFKLEDASRVCQANIERSRSDRLQPSHTRRTDTQPRIVGSSPAIQHVFRQIALVAPSDLSVLITGETGTGKELVAAAIHRYSLRAASPYIAIAPVALNPDLIESELFGHVKGSFTGASDDRVGLFEQAQGGTVLLDEIGDLPLPLQAKLLRVLEQGEYCRVGEMSPRRCDVRILAATNCDLNQAVGDKRFREDLYYRLSGMHIHLPPLRERGDDLRELCSYFLARVTQSASEHVDRRPAEPFSPSLLADLQTRQWHGNVRELKNAVEHAAVVARGRTLQISDFPLPNQNNARLHEISIEQVIRCWAKESLQKKPADKEPLHARFLATAEPALLQFAIDHTGGSRIKAAELLGIHRGTLRDRLRAYGMDD